MKSRNIGIDPGILYGIPKKVSHGSSHRYSALEIGLVRLLPDLISTPTLRKVDLDVEPID